MKPKFKETRILYNDDYYLLNLICSAPDFKKNVTEFYKYYEDNSAPIPEKGFKRPLEKTYYKWLAFINEAQLMYPDWKLVEILKHYIDAPNDALLLGLKWKLVFKTKQVPISPPPISWSLQEGFDPQVIVKFSPGITYQEWNETWKRIQTSLKGNEPFNIKNVEKTNFQRDLHLYVLYSRLAKEKKNFLKGTWLARWAELQDDKDYKNLDKNYNIDYGNFKVIIRRCIVFCERNPSLKPSTLF